MASTTVVLTRPFGSMMWLGLMASTTVVLTRPFGSMMLLNMYSYCYGTACLYLCLPCINIVMARPACIFACHVLILLGHGLPGCLLGMYSYCYGSAIIWPMFSFMWPGVNDIRAVQWYGIVLSWHACVWLGVAMHYCYYALLLGRCLAKRVLLIGLLVGRGLVEKYG